MKKHILAVLSVLICSMSLVCVDAKSTSNPTVSSAIKMYKAQNYSQCYDALSIVVKNDPSNALAYYYLAMASAQIGKRDEAIQNYEKVLSLAPDPQLERYAAKGKRCLETPEQCNEESVETELDKFIQSSYGTGLSDVVRSDYEKQKIENLMREMNRGKDVEPTKFKDYKDFSSQAPSNDEIVAALRVLQRAGLTNVAGVNGVSELSLLTGSQNENAALLNMLTGKGTSNLSPQVIQSLLTNQMSIGF